MNASISYSFNPLWRDGGTSALKQRRGSQKKTIEGREKEYNAVDWKFYRLVKWQLDNKICLETSQPTDTTAAAAASICAHHVIVIYLFVYCFILA